MVSINDSYENEFFVTGFMICLLTVGCNKKDNSNTAPAANTSAVSIENFAFTASTLTVKRGTTVTWTNHDAAAHTVTADDGSYNSGNLAQNATYNHTYSQAGTYTYHCNIHTMMKGTVVVQ